MPHVVVKLWPGKSEQQKARLIQEITDSVMLSVLNYGAKSVSVAFEEVDRRIGRGGFIDPISMASGLRSTKSWNTRCERTRIKLNTCGSSYSPPLEQGLRLGAVKPFCRALTCPSDRIDWRTSPLK